jgi:hypothetical protein
LLAFVLRDRHRKLRGYEVTVSETLGQEVFQLTHRQASRLDTANQWIRESAIGFNRYFLRQIRIVVYTHAQDIAWSKGMFHGRHLALHFPYPAQGRALRRRWQPR